LHEEVLAIGTPRVAVEPLERTVQWEAGEVPETFPSGV
jgi:hypothetical protein